MSIRRPAERYLVNLPVASPATVVVTNGIITFPGLDGMPDIPVESVESCYRYCTSACTAQVTTITPTVPTAPCECPWTWEMHVVMKQDLNMATNKVFGRIDDYSFTDPSGAVPTVSQIVTGIVDQVNTNPYSQVTAAAVGSPGSYTAFTLTEKDCSGNTENYSVGFTATFTQGTQSTNTPALPVLNFATLKKLFMEKPGYFAGVQEAPLQNSNYCLYRLKVDTGYSAGPHLANERADRYAEYEFYVRNDGTSAFTTGWDTPLTAELPCLGSPL